MMVMVAVAVVDMAGVPAESGRGNGGGTVRTYVHRSNTLTNAPVHG